MLLPSRGVSGHTIYASLPSPMSNHPPTSNPSHIGLILEITILTIIIMMMIRQFIRRHNMSMKSLQGRHTPGSRDECRTAPDGRRPLNQAHRLEPLARLLAAMKLHRHHFVLNAYLLRYSVADAFIFVDAHMTSQKAILNA